MSLINEIKEMLSEVTKVNFKGNKFVLKIDVNEDPNKKGIKVQFLPTTFAGMSKQQQDEIAMELGAKLNQGLAQLGLTVERDRELKDKTILGFFIYIEYLDKIIINALNQAAQPSNEIKEGEKANKPSTKPIEVSFKELTPLQKKKVQAFEKIVGGKHSQILNTIHGMVLKIDKEFTDNSYRLNADYPKTLKAAKARWVETSKDNVKIGF